MDHETRENRAQPINAVPCYVLLPSECFNYTNTNITESGAQRRGRKQRREQTGAKKKLRRNVSSLHLTKASRENREEEPNRQHESGETRESAGGIKWLLSPARSNLLAAPPLPLAQQSSRRSSSLSRLKRSFSTIEDNFDSVAADSQAPSIVLPLRPTRLFATTVRPVPDLKGFSYDLMWEVPLDDLFLAEDFSSRWCSDSILTEENARVILGKGNDEEGDTHDHHHDGRGRSKDRLRRNPALSASSSVSVAAQKSSGADPTAPTIRMDARREDGSVSYDGISGEATAGGGRQRRGSRHKGKVGAGKDIRQPNFLLALFKCCCFSAGRRQLRYSKHGEGSSEEEDAKGEGSTNREMRETELSSKKTEEKNTKAKGSGATANHEKHVGNRRQDQEEGVEGEEDEEQWRCLVPLLYESAVFRKSSFAKKSLFRQPVPIEYVSSSSPSNKSNAVPRRSPSSPVMHHAAGASSAVMLASSSTPQSRSCGTASAASPSVCTFPSPSSEPRLSNNKSSKGSTAEANGGHNDDDAGTRSDPLGGGGHTVRDRPPPPQQAGHVAAASYAAVSGHWTRLGFEFPFHHQTSSDASRRRLSENKKRQKTDEILLASSGSQSKVGLANDGQVEGEMTEEIDAIRNKEEVSNAQEDALNDAEDTYTKTPSGLSSFYGNPSHQLPYRGVRSQIITIGDLRLQLALSWSRHRYHNQGSSSPSSGGGGSNGNVSATANPAAGSKEVVVCSPPTYAELIDSNPTSLPHRPSSATAAPQSAASGVRAPPHMGGVPLAAKYARELVSALALYSESQCPAPLALQSYMYLPPLSTMSHSNSDRSSGWGQENQMKRVGAGSGLGPRVDPLANDTLSFQIIALDDHPSAANLNRSLGLDTSAVVNEYKSAILESQRLRQQQQQLNGNKNDTTAPQSSISSVPAPDRAYFDNVAAERCFMQLLSQGHTEESEVKRRLRLDGHKMIKSGVRDAVVQEGEEEEPDQEDERRLLLCGSLPSGSLSHSLLEPVNKIVHESQRCLSLKNTERQQGQYKKIFSAPFPSPTPSSSPLAQVEGPRFASAGSGHVIAPGTTHKKSALRERDAVGGLVPFSAESRGVDQNLPHPFGGVLPAPSHSVSCDTLGCTVIDKVTNPYSDEAIYALNWRDHVLMAGEEEAISSTSNTDYERGRGHLHQQGGGGTAEEEERAQRALADTTKYVNSANGSIVGGVVPTAMGIDLASTAVLASHSAHPSSSLAGTANGGKSKASLVGTPTIFPNQQKQGAGGPTAPSSLGGSSNARGGSGAPNDRELELMWERRCSYQVELIYANPPSAIKAEQAKAAATGLTTANNYAARKRVAEGNFQHSRRSIGFLNLHPLADTLEHCVFNGEVPRGYHDNSNRVFLGEGNQSDAMFNDSPAMRYVLRLRVRIAVGHSPNFLTHLRYFYFLHTNQRIMRAVRVREMRMMFLIETKARQKARRDAANSKNNITNKNGLLLEANTSGYGSEGQQGGDGNERRNNDTDIAHTKEIVSQKARAAALEASPIARGGSAGVNGYIGKGGVLIDGTSPPAMPSLRRPPVANLTPEKDRKQTEALDPCAVSPSAPPNRNDGRVQAGAERSPEGKAERRHLDPTHGETPLQQKDAATDYRGHATPSSTMAGSSLVEKTNSIKRNQQQGTEEEQEAARKDTERVNKAVSSAEKALLAHPLVSTHFGRTGLFNHGITCFVNSILQICFNSGVLRWDVGIRAQSVIERIVTHEAAVERKQEDILRQQIEKQKRYGTHGLGVSSDEDEDEGKDKPLGNRQNADLLQKKIDAHPNLAESLVLSENEIHLLALESVFRRLEGCSEQQLLAAGFGPVLVKKYTPEKCVSIKQSLKKPSAASAGGGSASSPSKKSSAVSTSYHQFQPLPSDVGDAHTPAEMVGTMPLLKVMGLPPTQQEDAHEFLSFRLLPSFYSHLTRLHTIPIAYVTVPVDDESRVLSRREDVLTDLPLVVQGCPSLESALLKEFSYGSDTVPFMIYDDDEPTPSKVPQNPQDAKKASGAKKPARSESTVVEAKRRTVIDVTGGRVVGGEGEQLNQQQQRYQFNSPSQASSLLPTARLTAVPDEEIKKWRAVAAVLPPILIMHAKRFDSNLRKIHVRQRYPFLLSAAGVLAQSEEMTPRHPDGNDNDMKECTIDEDPYVLYAVVAHHGHQSDSGHYTCYIRTPVETIPAPSRRFLGSCWRGATSTKNKESSEGANKNRGKECTPPPDSAFIVFDTDVDHEDANRRVRESLLSSSHPSRIAPKGEEEGKEKDKVEEEIGGAGDVYFHYDDELVYPVPFLQFGEHIAGTHWTCPSSSAYILWYIRRSCWREVRKVLILTNSCGIQHHYDPFLISPQGGGGGGGDPSSSFPSDSNTQNGTELFNAILGRQRGNIETFLHATTAVTARSKPHLPNDAAASTISSAGAQQPPSFSSSLASSLGRTRPPSPSRDLGRADKPSHPHDHHRIQFIPCPTRDAAKYIVEAGLAPPTIPIRGGYRVRSIAAWEEALGRHVTRQRLFRRLMHAQAIAKEKREEGGERSEHAAEVTMVADKTKTQQKQKHSNKAEDSRSQQNGRVVEETAHSDDIDGRTVRKVSSLDQKSREAEEEEEELKSCRSSSSTSTATKTINDNQQLEDVSSIYDDDDDDDDDCVPLLPSPSLEDGGGRRGRREDDAEGSKSRQNPNKAPIIGVPNAIGETAVEEEESQEGFGDLAQYRTLSANGMVALLTSNTKKVTSTNDNTTRYQYEGNAFCVPTPEDDYNRSAAVPTESSSKGAAAGPFPESNTGTTKERDIFNRLRRREGQAAEPNSAAPAPSPAIDDLKDFASIPAYGPYYGVTDEPSSPSIMAVAFDPEHVRHTSAMREGNRNNNKNNNNATFAANNVDGEAALGETPSRQLLRGDEGGYRRHHREGENEERLAFSPYQSTTALKNSEGGLPQPNKQMQITSAYRPSSPLPPPPTTAVSRTSQWRPDAADHDPSSVFSTPSPSQRNKEEYYRDYSTPRDAATLTVAAAETTRNNGIATVAGEISIGGLAVDLSFPTSPSTPAAFNERCATATPGEEDEKESARQRRTNAPPIPKGQEYSASPARHNKHHHESARYDDVDYDNYNVGNSYYNHRDGTDNVRGINSVAVGERGRGDRREQPQPHTTTTLHSLDDSALDF